MCLASGPFSAWRSNSTRHSLRWDKSIYSRVRPMQRGIPLDSTSSRNCKIQHHREKCWDEWSHDSSDSRFHLHGTEMRDLCGRYFTWEDKDSLDLRGFSLDAIMFHRNWSARHPEWIKQISVELFEESRNYLTLHPLLSWSKRDAGCGIPKSGVWYPAIVSSRKRYFWMGQSMCDSICRNNIWTLFAALCRKPFADAHIWVQMKCPVGRKANLRGLYSTFNLGNFSVPIDLYFCLPSQRSEELHPWVS
jgi:hypothetical protein